MHNFQSLLTKKTAREVWNEDGTLPKLFRTYNKRQFIELLIGLVTLMIHGIGVLFLVASLVDLYLLSSVYKVRNMQTGESFLMEHGEWKKYRTDFKRTKH